MDQIYTSDGWQDFDHGDLLCGDYGCAICGAVATNDTQMGKDVFWATCKACNLEIQGNTYDGMIRSEYEADYFTGWD